MKGPGRDLFLAVKDALGDLPIIAEDLGFMTADVLALRDSMGFPGMKILQFAFNGDPRQEYLPHNYAPNCVVYSGTHDNDTAVGWFASASATERETLARYVGGTGEVHWDLIRLAFGSIADMAVVPLQDVLGLGSEARMNTPGQPGGNWGWRYADDDLTPEIRARLKDITAVYGRGLPAEETKPRHLRRPPSTHPRPGHVGGARG
jgi:4-alpha-glucanotransferase